MPAQPSGIGLAMKYFGRTEGQGIKGFQEEWAALSDVDKKQLTQGLSDGTLNY